MTAMTEASQAGKAETDVISLTIPAELRFVRLARIAVASLARRKGMTVRTIDDLRMVTDESFALLLQDRDHAGSIDVTFEVDNHELVVVIVQRLADGPLPVSTEELTQFEVVTGDLVDRAEANPTAGVVQFSKRFAPRS